MSHIRELMSKIKRPGEEPSIAGYYKGTESRASKQTLTGVMASGIHT